MAADHYSAEIWKDIPGWEGFYQASSEGRIRTVPRISTLRHGSGKMMQRPVRGRILRPGFAKRTGYWIVVLVNGKITKTIAVHVAVCGAFHGPRPKGLDVAHENGDKADNRPANLSYKTRKENLADQLRHGTRLHGEKRWNAKLTAKDVFQIIRRRRAGESQTDLGAEYGVQQSVISNIMRGRSWSRTTGIGG